MKILLKILSILSLVISVTFDSMFNIFAKSPDNYLDINSITDNGVSLSLPQTLGIIYPKTVSTVTGDTFYIAGTSDPNQPLYFNDQEFSDRKQNGLFELTVSIPQNGVYNCIFKQGDITKVVPIFKNVAANSSYNGFSLPSMINRSTTTLDSSIYPTQNIIISEKKVKLQCSALSGSTVTAQFCGETFQLYQEKVTSEIGVSAKYSTTIDLSSYLEDDKSYNLGNIIYNIDFQGNVSQKTSVGKIYYSKRLPSFAKVSWEYGFLKNSSNNDTSGVISVLKKGTVDKVLKEENNMYQLGCGGWISKKFIEPIFESIEIQNNINKISFSQDQKSERLILEGTSNPVFTSAMSDNKLLVRLYNTVGNLDLSSLSETSSLFSEITSKNENGYLELIFNFKDDNILWGYNIEFDENNTIIYAAKKPSLSSDNNRPLSNITVVVDAGHGGSDTGALGLVGEVGGFGEKDINLVNALAVKKRLESLGAKVVMTRDDDKYVSLSDRATTIERTKADFVIVLHADAAPVNMMAKGLTVHYTTNNRLSMPFSSMIANVASNYTERQNRGIKNTDFYVARSTVSPTAFIEAGFLTNLSDTASLSSTQNIFDIANAVGDVILNCLNSF